eukprot:CAMPEP_0117656568 /NCGR_PEP_ID=MMETSP0804-20121206/4874_1 /TAXON_ID=1074897 /ORGANISM="Tetraselmis astigmatica, Strain CCMP880" /LENGTH=451 /DNA_ID=CAMNT_0005462979 /DNA_START=248 /DNA_END=1603 /DNA_ORIENTATION=+
MDFRKAFTYLGMPDLDMMEETQLPRSRSQLDWAVLDALTDDHSFAASAPSTGQRAGSIVTSGEAPLKDASITSTWSDMDVEDTDITAAASGAPNMNLPRRVVLRPSDSRRSLATAASCAAVPNDATSGAPTIMKSIDLVRIPGSVPKWRRSSSDLSSQRSGPNVPAGSVAAAAAAAGAAASGEPDREATRRGDNCTMGRFDGAGGLAKIAAASIFSKPKFRSLSFGDRPLTARTATGGGSFSQLSSSLIGQDSERHHASAPPAFLARTVTTALNLGSSNTVGGTATVADGSEGWPRVTTSPVGVDEETSNDSKPAAAVVEDSANRIKAAASGCRGKVPPKRQATAKDSGADTSCQGNEVLWECQAEGCGSDVTRATKVLYRRHRLCDTCARKDSLVVRGREVRFCQQCSTLHPLTEFEGHRRSCRTMLAKHLDLVRRRRAAARAEKAASKQ